MDDDIVSSASVYIKPIFSKYTRRSLYLLLSCSFLTQFQGEVGNAGVGGWKETTCLFVTAVCRWQKASTDERFARHIEKRLNLILKCVTTWSTPNTRARIYLFFVFRLLSASLKNKIKLGGGRDPQSQPHTRHHQGLATPTESTHRCHHAYLVSRPRPLSTPCLHTWQVLSCTSFAWRHQLDMVGIGNHNVFIKLWGFVLWTAMNTRQPWNDLPTWKKIPNWLN